MAQHTIAQTQRKLAAIDGNRALAKVINTDAMALAAELARAAATVRNQIEQEALGDAKLSLTAFQVLWVIWAWPNIETREVASELGIGKSALSGVLATLEHRSLILRTKSRDDARLVQLNLTPAGLSLFEDLLPKVNGIETDLRNSVDSANQALLVDLLSQFANR